ncbi:MAG: LamG-like jellyroll fold domain-containing protein [Gammaproteobacteria bacterium]
MLANLFFFCSSYAQAGQVTLAWDASTSSGVAGYEINYGPTSGSYVTQVDVGNQTSHTVTGLNDGATYYFAAKAYNSGKTTFSGFSNEVSTTTASAPTASFTANPTSGTAPLTVTFTDNSTGNITTWSWNFGDGTTSAAKNAAKTYTNPGSYTVGLTVTGPAGTNTATRTISVATAAPVANFTATPISGSAPLAVTFTNGSSGTVSGYSWSFGDGGTSTAPNPAYTYTKAGTYSVSLTATGPGGTNTKTQNGYITVSSGLVGAYNFEEASGTTVVDASGMGNKGTIRGAARITQGRFGNALSFDGVDDWVTVNDSASLDLTTGVTLEAWVYPIVDMTQWATVILKEQSGGALYELYANSDQSQPLTSVTVGRRYRVLSGGPWLLTNQWTHLAATYDGTIQRLYVNGIQVAQRPQTGPIQVSSNPLRLGGNSVWGDFFKGRIDEVRVYQRALSAAEINADLNSAIATSTPPVFLVGHQAVAPVPDSNPQGTAQAFQAQAAVTGWVTNLSVYVDTGSTATGLIAGIYSDNSGHPGSQLAQGTLNSPASGGWNKVPLPPVRTTAGTKYWIAILSPTGVVKFRNQGGFTGGLSETSAQKTLTTLPGTWTSGAQVLEGPLSAYGAGYP